MNALILLPLPEILLLYISLYLKPLLDGTSSMKPFLVLSKTFFTVTLTTKPPVCREVSESLSVLYTFVNIIPSGKYLLGEQC